MLTFAAGTDVPTDASTSDLQTVSSLEKVLVYLLINNLFLLLLC